MEGWIKLHRQIEENEYWFSEKFTKSQAWIDLLLMARHDSGLVTIRGIDINLKPGQLCWSQVSLAKRWRWNRKTVKKFLNQLKKREMVDIRISRVTTIISINNWDSYQGVDNKRDNKRDTNKNVKNGKKELIDLAFSLIESIQRESSVYSIVNKYAPALGEDKLHDILLAFERKGNRFKNENLLAAYLEKCTQGNGRITDTIPFIEAGTPGYI